MSKTILRIGVVSVSLLPFLVEAQTIGGMLAGAVGLVQRLIVILVSLAVLVFFWGLVKFIAHADDEKAVEEGKQLMIWGMIGLFVMVALWGIVGYIQQSLGLDLAPPHPERSAQPSTIPA